MGEGEGREGVIDGCVSIKRDEMIERSINQEDEGCETEDGLFNLYMLRVCV